jgi:hypothetical protein
MRIHFGQIYVEPGVDFPFSHTFQHRLAIEITALVEPSAKFVKEFGKDFELMFNVSAKRAIHDNEIRGPTVFRKAKDAEYTVFLPFDVITGQTDAPRRALKFLLKGICDVFDLLEIDKAKLLDKEEAIIEGICSDPTMLEEPSWNEDENKTLARRLFATFFGKNQRA